MRSQEDHCADSGTRSTHHLSTDEVRVRSEMSPVALVVRVHGKVPAGGQRNITLRAVLRSEIDYAKLAAPSSCWPRDTVIDVINRRLLQAWPDAHPVRDER